MRSGIPKQSGGARFFDRPNFALVEPPTRTDAPVSSPGRRQVWRDLSASELAAGWCTPRCAAGALVLVPENQAALLQVVGRHLNGHSVARQRLDPVLFHLAGGVGDDLVTGIELHAVARIGEDFGDQSF